MEVRGLSGVWSRIPSCEDLSVDSDSEVALVYRHVKHDVEGRMDGDLRAAFLEQACVNDVLAAIGPGIGQGQAAAYATEYRAMMPHVRTA